jgi:microcystin-dependent protein
MHVGEIRRLTCNYEPEGWAWCDGRMLDPKQYPDLFRKIGTTYGGDGKTTFAVPDLRARAPLHRGNGEPLGTAGSIQFDARQARQRARVAVHSIIGLTSQSGNYPDDTPMTGEVQLWAMERAPRDWAVCAGQLLPSAGTPCSSPFWATPSAATAGTPSPFPTSKARSPFTRASRTSAARLRA